MYRQVRIHQEEGLEAMEVHQMPLKHLSQLAHSKLQDLGAIPKILVYRLYEEKDSVAQYILHIQIYLCQPIAVRTDDIETPVNKRHGPNAG